ncbi:uncharacterized protein LOC132178216 [Corylus avellana]|uniref:uncharacterized protein LOC132178216 n=1 Tax=Corylus avellana TaxID=13451 RepID=UPI00286AEB52|nr:uncharacterized protein LOC132178216 [Corylus avellana]
MWGKKGFMAVKLDMSKAYNRVELNFLEAVMHRMGFHDRWIGLIMMCVKSVQYSILVNGKPCGLISPTRGIRQGDPISLYLFLLCAEALSAMISHANDEGVLTGVPTSKKGPTLSHLFFADDSLLFCRSTIAQWNSLSFILQVYEGASGQKMNSNKTALFFSRNAHDGDKEQIQRLAGIPINQRYDTYLGLPTLVGRSQTRAFNNIKERVWKRLQDWKLKFLSQAGKEILLKAVIQAIPTYCMSVFKLPKVLCSEINSLMTKFFWSHKEKEKRIHWMSWSKMSLSKTQGGMGFRDIVTFNKALLAKQIWRLWKSPDSLIAKIMKAKYYLECSVLDAPCGKKLSFAWRSIQNASDLVNEGLIWRVGNGRSIRIWQDRWIKSPTTYRVLSPPSVIDPTSTVSVLIDHNTKWWNPMMLEQLFSREEMLAIQSILVSSTDQEDTLIWRGTAKGIFTVRSTYHLQRERDMAGQAEGSSNARNHPIWRTFGSSPNQMLKSIFFGVLATIYYQLEPSFVTGRSSRIPHVVEGLFHKCDQVDFAKFVSIARRIWLRHNEFIHDGLFAHPNIIVLQATQATEAFLALLGTGKPARDSASVSPVYKWQAPPQGWLQANWDARVDRNQACVGLGIIIRDHHGVMRAARNQIRKGCLDPTAAEGMAALLAIQTCVELGFSKVQLEGDAKSIIEAVKSGEPDDSATGQLTADIRSMVGAIPDWEMIHTRREANQVAHCLARAAIIHSMDKVWLYDPPDCIRDHLQADLSALLIST